MSQDAPRLPLSTGEGLPSPVPTTLAAVDICRFGARSNARTQLHLRREMYALIAEACRITRVPWAASYREDRGDGALFIVPPDVAAEHLLDPFAHHLVAVLRRYNRLSSHAAQLKLRLAVHTGRVHSDDHGVTGPALVHLFRLLDAPAFKKIAADTADLAVIVSDRLYTDVTEGGGLIDPTAYKPQRITCKETRTRAWIWTPPAH
ncbi:hypothetical protein [Actinomadura sp. 3N407]|uniref:hypothetical protein n=1 Tax=Actinomadura sp. 3N407 TaxID=3457423 RepID=UPI003FCE2C14